MSHFDIHCTFMTAVKYGGSFYKALGGAGLLADTANRERLLAAFPEMEATYGPQTAMHRYVRYEVLA